jgi:cytochrome c oxidase assembly factor CtaG
MTEHMMHMAAMGLLVAVVAPTLLLVLGRAVPRLDRWTLPAAVALPGFITLHATVTVYTDRAPLPLPLDTATQFALLCGAMLFWAPVLGVRRRLPDAGRMLYLYTAIPLLDLTGVWLVAVGDSPGGLSMITGMLPMGMATVAITWNWINREERRAVLDKRPAHWVSPAGRGTGEP